MHYTEPAIITQINPVSCEITKDFYHPVHSCIREKFADGLDGPKSIRNNYLPAQFSKPAFVE
ncbi:MAG: hypothetical protein D6784_02680 [Chloroflexi bacterium]|nr:MAG: hypothetical protein D6784_02680 [Chloroflexota bacterium]